MSSPYWGGGIVRVTKKVRALPLREECDPNYDPEVWQPHWKCFCCEDTGIAKWAIHLFMEGYKDGKSKIPVCQNLGCEAGSSLGVAPSLQNSLDWRLEPVLCQEADLWNRKQWREWAKDKQQRIKNQKYLKQGLAEIGCRCNLRKRDRTTEEHNLAQRKHEEILNEFVAPPN